MRHYIKTFLKGGAFGIITFFIGITLHSTLLQDSYPEASDHWITPPLIEILLFPFYLTSYFANNPALRLLIGISVIIISYGFLFLIIAFLFKLIKKYLKK